ncbi:hypothetical protein [Paracraurococcus lichenis]|uniref:Uncharacterized protein n=1 Tax=Paracraurococcus lichenis TaxID=3064888 RepID=A0ABT9E909_9PROT|nr:hypothetical protein [Paracraurococcus sp. LOR1-02]MDO9712687.1 hypothetical protein [Paracraurococcus sp. LOR1-02]
MIDGNSTGAPKTVAQQAAQARDSNTTPVFVVGEQQPQDLAQAQNLLVDGREGERAQDLPAAGDKVTKLHTTKPNPVADGAVQPSSPLNSLPATEQNGAPPSNNAAPNPGSPKALFRVSGLALGQPDELGRTVEAIFARRAPYYAVYKVRRGPVAVQFADNDVTDIDHAAQRALIQSVSRLRIEYDALADRWIGGGGDPCHRELGLALVDALEGEPDLAAFRMQQGIDRLKAIRLKSGRVQYAFFTAIWCVVSLLALYLIAPHIIQFSLPADNVWLVAKAAVLGAAFSTAMNIRERKVAPDQDPISNLMDTGLRIATAVLGSGFLLIALGSGMISPLVMGDFKANTTATWQAVISLGFICGFLERLVPSLLERPSSATNGDEVVGTTIRSGTSAGSSANAGKGALLNGAPGISKPADGKGKTSEGAEKAA